MKLNFSNLGFWDISLTKLSVLCSTLFLVSVWPQFANWVLSVHWGWFLAAGILLGIKPMIAVFSE